MRITDRSPTGRRLQTIFFPAEPKPVMPSEVSDEIILTHPAIPPMVGFKEGMFRFNESIGGLGSSVVLGPLVPTERYWWVQLLDFRHDDPVDRRLGLAMQDTVPNEVLIHQQPAVSLANIGIVLERPFLLPNDTRFVVRSNNMAAGQVLTLRFFFLEFLHAEVNPHA